MRVGALLRRSHPHQIIQYPGIAKLVSRLVWDQETVRSSRTTRTKIPLKSLISEGFSYSLSIAAQDLTVVAEIRRLIVIFTKLYYNKLTVGLCAAKAAVWFKYGCFSFMITLI